MGLRNKARAVIIMRASLWICVIGCAVYTFVLFLIKDMLLKGFTDDTETYLYALGLTNVFLFKHVPNAIQLTLSNTLKAIGKEKIGSIIVFIDDYLYNIPMAAFLIFAVGMGVLGVGYANLSGIVLKCGLFGLVLRKTDWDDQIMIISAIMRKRKETEDRVELE